MRWRACESHPRHYRTRRLRGIIKVIQQGQDALNEITAVAFPGASPLGQILRDGVVVATVTMLESSQAGFFTASVPPGLPAGTYHVVVTVQGLIVATGTLVWDGSREVDVPEMVRRIHAIEGLDPQAPLINTRTSRSAGDVHQVITGDDELTTVRAVP